MNAKLTKNIGIHVACQGLSLAFALLVLLGCESNRAGKEASNRIEKVLSETSAQMHSTPGNIFSETSSMPRHKRMKMLLLQCKAQADNGTRFVSDSIARQLASYYDDGKSAENKALAYYILGCASLDCGKVESAISSLLLAKHIAGKTETLNNSAIAMSIKSHLAECEKKYPHEYVNASLKYNGEIGQDLILKYKKWMVVSIVSLFAAIISGLFLYVRELRKRNDFMLTLRLKERQRALMEQYIQKTK